MTNQRGGAAQNKGVRRGLNSNDFISIMPDEVLLMILCLLPIKDAVVTSSLSTRWRFLWLSLYQLNFDGSTKFDKMAMDLRVFVSEHYRYINQVKSVIRSYKQPMVQDFRIRFHLNNSHKKLIDGWLNFAFNKEVQMLELYLVKSRHKVHGLSENYDFPSRLYGRNMGKLFKSPSSNATVVEIVSLKQLILKNVNVRESILQEFLSNSPHLEMISIHGSGYLKHIRVGGRAILNLKHFEIRQCPLVESIHLSDFELVSFTYKVEPMDLRLANLPKLSELDIYQGLTGLETNLFNQISPCAPSLMVLSIKIYHPKENLKLDSLPELPNVKKLRLTIGAHDDDSLLEFTSIAKACPSLETLTIKLLWFSPIKNRRKVRHVATRPHEHLKIFQILGYYGRISDLELVAYVIDNAFALKKIVIDPRFQNWKGSELVKDFMKKKEEAARSFAERQLVSISPQDVDLVIL